VKRSEPTKYRVGDAVKTVRGVGRVLETRTVQIELAAMDDEEAEVLCARLRADLGPEWMKRWQNVLVGRANSVRWYENLELTKEETTGL